MKKNILAIILLAVVCFGCGREERGHITQRGKEIHDTWCDLTRTILSKSVVSAFQFSAFLAADDSLQRVIADECFAQQHIWQDGENVYGVYENGVCQVSINTNGALLTDAGATWRITVSHYPYFSCPVPEFMTDSDGSYTLNIAHLAGNQWRITLDSASYKGSTADLTLELPDGTALQEIEHSALTLSGSGKYYFGAPSYVPAVDDYPVLLHYTIVNPLQQGNAFFKFEEGEIQYVATKQNKEDIPVTAKFLGGDCVKITYRDFSETWVDDVYFE